MIKVIKHEEPWIPDNGDIDIYGLAHHVRPTPKSLGPTEHYIPLDYFSLNPWDAAWKAGIDCIAQCIKQLCPITCLQYCSWIPDGIVTKDVSQYPVPEQFRRMANDKSWTDRYYLGSINKIGLTLLGTGYSLGIMPYDGSGSLIHLYLSLDNGDKLTGVGHVWYNK